MFAQCSTFKPDRVSLRFLLAIAGVCLLAWAMFVIHLGDESMWVDEWYSWMYAVQGPIALVRDTASDVHPPLYYQLLSVWIMLTGSQSLFVMRLTAAIPALLTVALTFRLAYEWFRSRMAGIAAAAFLGTSGFFVYYARELRMYALTALLAALSWWFLTRILQGRKRSLLGYSATVALMAYTYYFSAFVLFAQMIVVAWFYRSKLRDLLKAYGVVLIAFLPWIPTLINQIVVERLRAGNPDAVFIGKFAATSQTDLRTIGKFIEHYTAAQPVFVLLLLVLAFGLGWGATWNGHARRWLIAAALWVFLTTVLMFGLNVALPIYNPRYLLPILPGLALLVSVAVGSMSSRQVGVGLIGVIAISGMIFHADAFQEEKTPHQDMLKTVSAEYRPGDRIWYNFSYGGLGSSISEEVAYHLQFDAPNLQPDDFIWDAPNDYADVSVVPRVWDVRPYWIPMPDAAVPALLNGRVLSEEYLFGAYTVRLYEAPPADETPIAVGDLFEMLPAGVHRNAYQPGDTVILKTWWQALEPPSLDYSYIVELISENEDQIVQKQDAGLMAGGIPTSQWLPDQPSLLSEIRFDLPSDLAPGPYNLWLGIYYWENPQALPMNRSDHPSAGVQGRIQVGTVIVEG